jgi:hypothetical protein
MAEPSNDMPVPDVGLFAATGEFHDGKPVVVDLDGRRAVIEPIDLADLPPEMQQEVKAYLARQARFAALPPEERLGDNS